MVFSDLACLVVNEDNSLSFLVPVGCVLKSSTLHYGEFKFSYARFTADGSDEPAIISSEYQLSTRLRDICTSDEWN